MEHIINITIRNKIAAPDIKAVYICGNSDFVAVFDFDEEWSEHNIKTARFAYGQKHIDVVFEGNRCPVPIMSNIYVFKVGVFAGDLRTTTPAHVSARKSILCESGVPADPTPDVYAQIMEKLNSMSGVDPETVAAAVQEYMAANPVKETDPTVPDWAKAETKPSYTAEEVGAVAASELNSAVNAALAQAKESGEFDGADGNPGADGYTPVKGTDYFTAADKAELVEDVLAALPTWTGGSY